MPNNSLNKLRAIYFIIIFCITFVLFFAYGSLRTLLFELTESGRYAKYENCIEKDVENSCLEYDTNVVPVGMRLYMHLYSSIFASIFIGLILFSPMANQKYDKEYYKLLAEKLKTDKNNG